MRRSWSLPVVVRRGSRLLLASALVLGSAAAASAQTPRVEGPFAGLFGGQGTRNTRHSLDARASLFGVYQDILEPSADLLRQIDPRFQKAGVFGGVSGGLAYGYARAARRASFSAGSNAFVSTFSSRPDLIIGNYSGTTALSANLTRRITFSASGTGSYSPFYNFGSGIGTVNAPLVTGLAGTPLFVQGSVPIGGGDATLPGVNFGIGAFFGPTVMLGAGSGLSANLTARTSLGISADYAQMRLLESDLRNSMWGTGAVLRHRLTRRLFARAGYRRGVGRLSTPGSEPFVQNGIEAGLDYGDSFAVNLGRRTRLTVAPAASIMRWNNRTQFRLNGNVTLAHTIGRTWSASAAYLRDVGFLAGFSQPVLTDSAVSSLAGTVSRRVRFTAMGTWMRGRFGFSSQQGFTWYVASSGLSIALARPAALFAQYAYTRADVPAGSTSVFTIPRIARQTVSVGLTLFAPIFKTNGRNGQ